MLIRIFKINNGWVTFVEQMVLLQMQMDSLPGFCLQIYLFFACLLSLLAYCILFKLSQGKIDFSPLYTSYCTSYPTLQTISSLKSVHISEYDDEFCIMLVHVSQEYPAFILK